MAIRKRDLENGDIVIFHGVNPVAVGQAAAKTMKVLTVIPALVSGASQGTKAFLGNVNAVHSGIVSKTHPTQPDLIHATNDGIQLDDISQVESDSAMSLEVFRLQGNPNLAIQAAETARTWSSTNKTSSKNIQYAKFKAFRSAFRNANFGYYAKKRASLYRQHRGTPGGPQDVKDIKRQKHKSMFCSMLVIACYQAIMDDTNTSRLLPLDAKNSTPMLLDGFLKGGNAGTWVSLGELRS